MFPNVAAMVWAQRAAELASLIGLAAIVAAESLVNLSRGPVRPSANRDDVYRNWGNEPQLVEVKARPAGFGRVLRFFAGPYFWAGLVAGGASAFAAAMLVRRLND